MFIQSSSTCCLRITYLAPTSPSRPPAFLASPNTRLRVSLLSDLGTQSPEPQQRVWVSLSSGRQQLCFTKPRIAQPQDQQCLIAPPCPHASPSPSPSFSYGYSPFLCSHRPFSLPCLTLPYRTPSPSRTDAHTNATARRLVSPTRPSGLINQLLDLQLPTLQPATSLHSDKHHPPGLHATLKAGKRIDRRTKLHPLAAQRRFLNLFASLFPLILPDLIRLLVC